MRIYNIPVPHFRDMDETQLGCEKEENVDLFFAAAAEGRGNRGEDADDRRLREYAAREVCAQCPFIIGCALHGLEFEDYGVWGGLTEQDRSALGGRGLGTPGPTPARNVVVKRLLANRIHEAVVERILRLWDAKRRKAA